MSAARPLGRLLAPFRTPGLPRRSFASTPIAALRRLPLPRNSPARPARPEPQEPSPRVTPYTPAEVEELSSHFSPEQLSALLAGEQAIDRADFARRTARRPGDPYELKYLDDLSTLNPVLDFAPPAPAKAGSEMRPIRQRLPVINDPELKYADEDQEGDMYRKLSQVTGMSTKDLRALRSRLMVIHSVTNQTRMGKIRKMYALAVAGNGNGLLGVGEGKAVEAEDAIRQATYMAMRNMEPIPRYENRTIYGDIVAKQGAVEMQLFARPPGFGVRCSAHIFEMCRCLGIQDLSARVTRSRNPMNVIKTFIKALKSQKLPETIARGRGMKFVDVRKVYYGGAV